MVHNATPGTHTRTGGRRRLQAISLPQPPDTEHGHVDI
jgi:hypothetical protein